MTAKRVFSLCNLSPKMSQMLGVSQTTRPEGLKLVWNYIKKNSTTDKDRKGHYICDPLMQEVFGKPELATREVMKLMSPHFIKIGEPKEPKAPKKVKKSPEK